MINDLLKVIKKGIDLPGKLQRNLGLKIRNAIVDTTFPGADNYHKNMYAKALTGGTKGTVEKLPEKVVSDVKSAALGGWFVGDPKDNQLSTYGTRYPYQMDGKLHTPGMRTAGSLGHVNLKIDPKGGKAMLTDRWDVDPDKDYIPFITKGHDDLREGGTLAARLYDISKLLGLYKDIDFKVPIQDPRLTPDLRYKRMKIGTLGTVEE